MTQAKHFLIINSKAPHGTVYAQEALDVLLITAAYEQIVSAAFIGDGVYQLLKQQNTQAISRKNFPNSYKALTDYGIEQIYIDKAALQERGLNEQDLIIPAQALEPGALANLFAQQDIILSF